MNSELATRLKLRYSPVAVLFSDEKPEKALEFAEQKWGCVAAMLTAAGDSAAAAGCARADCAAPSASTAAKATGAGRQPWGNEKRRVRMRTLSSTRTCPPTSLLMSWCAPYFQKDS